MEKRLIYQLLNFREMGPDVLRVANSKWLMFVKLQSYILKGASPSAFSKSYR